MEFIDVLVIGSAHLDIVADYKSQNSFLDKEGSLRISIGGTAYNIAANIKDKSHLRVALLTALNRNSISGEIIYNTLENNNIITDYVINSNSGWENGFVALTHNGTIKSAVSSTTIEHRNINAKTAIDKSKLIIIDCNLQSSQILDIIQYTHKIGKPLFICAVSEQKIKRSLNIRYEESLRPYTFFFMNSLEAKEILRYKKWDKSWEHINCKEEILKLCTDLKSKNVIITNGGHGYSIFSYNGDRYDFETPSYGIINTLGAGDALVAAVASYYVESNEIINWNTCHNYISEYVCSVLGLHYASPYALYKKIFPTYLGEPHKDNTYDIFGLIPYTILCLESWENLSNLITKEMELTVGIAKNIKEPNVIIKDIWSNIYYAKCIIVDYTDLNPNVFYELGIAHALGKKVIAIFTGTCKPPFDIAGIRYFHYDAKDIGKLFEDIKEPLNRFLNKSINDTE